MNKINKFLDYYNSISKFIYNKFKIILPKLNYNIYNKKNYLDNNDLKILWSNIVNKLNFNYTNIKDEDDWFPTPHGYSLCMSINDNSKIHKLIKNKDVLELGCGIGNQTLLIHRLGPKKLIITEITNNRLKSCFKFLNNNILNKNKSNNIEGVIGNWLNVEISTNDNKVDLIISNPPFCQSGKFNRRYYIDELILNSHQHLRKNGSIIWSQSSMADLDKSINDLIINGFKVEILGAYQYPWRNYYFDDILFEKQSEKVKFGFQNLGNIKYEIIYIIKATLLDYLPKIKH